MSKSTLQDLLGNLGETTETVGRSRHRLRWTLAIPWLLLFGFGALAWVLFGKTLLPSREVQLESIVTIRKTELSRSESESKNEATPESEINPWDGTVTFQASGWVEPDPLPIKATALINGVIDFVSVLEGEKVEKGQLLASLIREDFELDLATAESLLAAAKARAAAQDAAIKGVAAKEETLKQQVKAGEFRCLEMIDRRDRLIRAGGIAVAEGEIEQARLMLQTHEAEVAALAVSKTELQREREKLTAEKMELEARIREAETQVSRQKLALDRTEIRSPVDGIILRLHAVPGQKRMLDMDDPESSTIAVLFQPGFLQARIDVPLEEANQLSVGQAVRLRSGFLPGKVIRGVVTRIVGEADLQRNTLQAKVRIEDPDPRMRPDMLCRAEFLSPENSATSSKAEGDPSGPGSVSLFVPEAALIERSNNSAIVWTPKSGSQELEKKTIELDGSAQDGYILVQSGLLPGDRVVIDPPSDLKVGERFHTISQEETK